MLMQLRLNPHLTYVMQFKVAPSVYLYPLPSRLLDVLLVFQYYFKKKLKSTLKAYKKLLLVYFNKNIIRIPPVNAIQDLGGVPQKKVKEIHPYRVYFF